MAKYLGILIGMAVVFYIFQKYTEVKNSVGWNFVSSLGKVKKNLNKGLIVLRVKHPSGNEEYKIAKTAPSIKYTIEEDDKKVQKKDIYDESAVDKLNGIPILNVNPYDINPINRNTGLKVDVNPEVINKLAVDSTYEAESDQSQRKLVSTVIKGTIAAGVIMLLVFSYLYQQNVECQRQFTEYVKENGKAVVQGSIIPFLLPKIEEFKSRFKKR